MAVTMSTFVVGESAGVVQKLNTNFQTLATAINSLLAGGAHTHANLDLLNALTTTQATLTTLINTSHDANTDTGTSANTWGLGDGTNTTKILQAKTGATNLPFIRYNVAINKWEFSHDGVLANILGTGGGAGTSLTPRGVWVSGTSYVLNDEVVSGAGYLCIQAHTASAANAPGTTGGAPYWQKLVERGEAGTPGTHGPGFAVKGDWSSASVSYVKDLVTTDLVRHSKPRPGTWYSVVQSHTSSAAIEPGTAGGADYFALFLPAGEPSSLGDRKGEWALATSYAANDIVTLNGSTWWAKDAHTSTADDEPGVGTNTALHWEALAMKGETGTPGTATDGVDGRSMTHAGTWAEATNYTWPQLVRCPNINAIGCTWVCLTDHTSSAATKPGTAGGTMWTLLSIDGRAGMERIELSAGGAWTILDDPTSAVGPTYAGTTYGQMIPVLMFAPGKDLMVQWAFRLPANYSPDTPLSVTLMLPMLHETAGTFAFTVEAAAYNPGENYDQPWGDVVPTPVTCDVAGNWLQTDPASVTMGGSPTVGSMVMVRVTRTGTLEADTLPLDTAYLHAVSVQYQVAE